MIIRYSIGFALMIMMPLISAAETGPDFLDTDTDITAILGDVVVLPCSIANLSIHEVTWTDEAGYQLMNNEQRITQDNRFNVSRPSMLDWDLQIQNVQLWDSGFYLCEINTDPPLLRNVTLTVYDIPNSSPVSTPSYEVGLEDDMSTNIPNSSPVSTPSYEVGLEDDMSTNGTEQTNNTTTSPMTPTTSQPDNCSLLTQRCENGGVCSQGVCQCPGNYTGEFCQLPTTCPLHTCNINNTLNCSVEVENNSTRFQCNCQPSYKGQQCEIYDFCQFYPCQHNGQCNLLYPNGTYMCTCQTGDPSNNCNLNERDECASNPPNGEDYYITCTDEIGGYKMYCSPGHTGRGCQSTENAELFCTRNGQHFCRDEGYCKPMCNVDICNGTQNCRFTADPYNTTGFLKQAECMSSFGDGYDQQTCQGEEMLFDGFDKTLNLLTDCSPFFNTMCTADFGNRDCKPECNNADCLYDGFDCFIENVTQPLDGVVVVEFADVPAASMQKSISLMLRSRINMSQEHDYINEVHSLKISGTQFTDIIYVGKFLAAVVGKRPGWLDSVHIRDIYVCPAGSYSEVYSDKCSKNCSTCIQEGEVCDWKTGECLYGCPPAHWNIRCYPCSMCKQEGDVCDWATGDCLYGCRSGHWGHLCLPCNTTCKQEGEVCNNVTGDCLHGCSSNEFYGMKCHQCPLDCVGGCNELGHCSNCSSNKYGTLCEHMCGTLCAHNTCHPKTGVCDCGTGSYWSKDESVCEYCSNGCKGRCNATSGFCECKKGYYGNKCASRCDSMCIHNTCSTDGTCDHGCDSGYHGPMCNLACPVGCSRCSRDGGLCGGNCKPGYDGSTCEKSSGMKGNMDDGTDNTGVIIAIIISLLLVIIILVIACCYWKKRQSGDYVMEDEELEQPLKGPDSIQVHNNTYIQPTSPVLGHSGGMIELDDKHLISVYAGQEQLVHDAADNQEETDNEVHTEGDDEVAPSEETGTHEGKKERCTSSVIMEIGSNGRVLSVSDGDELQSPSFTKEVELTIGEETDMPEPVEDDDAFIEPPSSPLGAIRAPLASEEDLLSSLGPKELQYDISDEPAALEMNQDDDAGSKGSSKGSKTSRSSSSSSSSSLSSKSSKGSEITTEM